MNLVSIDSQQLFSVDPDDPLGFGLKSIAEPLQKWWLIGKGNPYWETDILDARRDLGIPESGFNDASSYVDWLARRWSRHGHNEEWPVFLEIEGTVIQNSESMTLYTHRDLTWPIEGFMAPGSCCRIDPLYQNSGQLAVQYGIDAAGEEPGFGNAGPRSADGVSPKT